MLKRIKRGVKKIMKKTEKTIETTNNIVKRLYNDLSEFINIGDNKIAIGLLFIVSGVLQNIRESK